MPNFPLATREEILTLSLGREIRSGQKVPLVKRFADMVTVCWPALVRVVLHLKGQVCSLALFLNLALLLEAEVVAKAQCVSAQLQLVCQLCLFLS